MNELNEPNELNELSELNELNEMSEVRIRKRSTNHIPQTRSSQIRAGRP